MSQELLIKLFENNQIRVIWDESKEDYYFCVNDIVTALTETVDAANYLKQLRHRDSELSKGWLQIVTPLSVETAGGLQKMNFSTLEGIFRIIQSIPSKKASSVAMPIRTATAVSSTSLFAPSQNNIFPQTVRSRVVHITGQRICA